MAQSVSNGYFPIFVFQVDVMELSEGQVYWPISVVEHGYRVPQYPKGMIAVIDNRPIMNHEASPY